MMSNYRTSRVSASSPSYEKLVFRKNYVLRVGKTAEGNLCWKKETRLTSREKLLLLGAKQQEKARSIAQRMMRRKAHEAFLKRQENRRKLKEAWEAREEARRKKIERERIVLAQSVELTVPYSWRPHHYEHYTQGAWDVLRTRALNRLAASLEKAANDAAKTRRTPRVIVEQQYKELTVGFNYYELLDVEPCPSFEEEIEECEDAFEFFEKKQRTRAQFIGHEYYGPYHVPRPVVEITERIRELLASLRAKIAYLAELRRPQRYRNDELLRGMEYHVYNDTVYPIARPQMDTEGPHGDTGIEKHQEGNVTLTSVEGASSAAPIAPSASWTQLSSSDVITKHKAIADRWLLIKRFEWSTDHVVDQEVFGRDLPIQCVVATEGDSKGKLDPNIPNTMVFSMHRYWRGDIEIRVEINSNRFQIGQLQACWYYENEFDRLHSTLRRNVATCSQTDHILISASASNSGTLYIPYRAHVPMLHTHTRSDMPVPLALGRFSIRVLNPLTVADGGPKSCNVAVFVRFPNSEFTGMIATNVDPLTIAVPQMEFVKLAENVLHTALNDNNQDNPTDYRPPQSIVPVASHSWSAGTGIVEPLQTLRLDPAGTTQHVDPPTDEMSIKYLCNKFGFVKTIEWTNDAKAESQLAKFPAAPLSDKSLYKTLTSDKSHEVDLYCLPPVSVISSMFYYWRGSLEFRFDITASAFHTGSLIVAYVPGATNATKVSLSTVKASPYMEFSLQDVKQFSYIVPYVANKPYWPRTYTGNFSFDSTMAPSMLYLFVLNPLIPMESVSDKVYINVYMRGGPDFEVSVPVQPSLGTGFNRVVLASSTELMHANSDSAPYYFGTYYGAVTITGKQFLVARMGTTSGRISYFETRWAYKRQNAFYFEIDDLATSPKVKTLDGQMIQPRYAVYLPDAASSGSPGKNTYMLALVWPQKAETARRLAAAARPVFGQDWTKEQRDTFITTWQSLFFYSTDTTVNEWTVGNPSWRPISTDTADFELIEYQGERENAVDSITTGTTLRTTNSGMHLFGERFIDLKDLCRRYQLYTTITLDAINMIATGQCSHIIPLLPQGLALDLGKVSDINEVTNRCREGVIPLIASGYRYYRGSLRLRILAPMLDDCVLVIQHRPDRKLRSDALIPCKDISTAEAVINHGYANTYQLSGVNGMIEFEVPFYQSGCFGLLQRPRFTTTSEAYHYSLGELVVSFQSFKPRSKQSINLAIYYSIADDMRFSTFQGFPPMLLLDDIPAVPQGLTDWFSGAANAVTDTVAKKAVTALDDKIDEVKTTISESVANIQEKLTTHSSIGQWFKDSPLARNLITNVIHASIAKNAYNTAFALASFLLELGIATVDTLQQWLTAFQELFSTHSIPEKTSNGAVSEDDMTAHPQGFEDSQQNRAVTGIVTLLYTGVCSLMGVTQAWKGKTTTWCSFLTKGLGDISRSASSIFHLLKNLFTVFQDMVEWIAGKLDRSLAHAKYLESEYPMLKDWLEEVAYLIRPSTKADIPYTPCLQDRVYDAHNLGNLLVQDLIKTDKDTKHGQVLLKFWEKLHKVAEDMEAMGLHPYVRKMPYGIRVCGEPGLGKSFMTEELCIELLKSIDYKTKKNVSFVLNCGTSKYWDQCDGQPVIVLDDMWNIETGEAFEAQVAALFAIMSPVVLCPPKAQLEEKKMRYNPEIFVQNTNKPFRVFPGIDRKALLRRAHILIRCVKSDKVKPGCEHCKLGLSPEMSKAQELQDYHHLNFYIAKDVTEDKDWHGPLTYTEMIDFIIPRFRANREKEAELFSRRVALQNEIREDPEDDATLRPLSDRIKIRKAKLLQQRLDQNESYFTELMSAPAEVMTSIQKHVIEMSAYAEHIVKEYCPFKFFSAVQPPPPVVTTKAVVHTPPSTTAPGVEVQPSPSTSTTPIPTTVTTPVVAAPQCSLDDYWEKILQDVCNSCDFIWDEEYGVVAHPQTDDIEEVEDNVDLGRVPSEPSGSVAGETTQEELSPWYKRCSNFCYTVIDSLIRKSKDVEPVVLPKGPIYDTIVVWYGEGFINHSMYKEMVMFLNEGIIPGVEYILVAKLLLTWRKYIEDDFKHTLYGMRSWLKFFKMVNKYCIETKTGCIHYCTKLEDVLWWPSLGCFQVGETRMTLCGARGCLLNTTLGTFYWSKMWFDASIVRKTQLRRGEFDKLPDFLRDDESLALYDDFKTLRSRISDYIKWAWDVAIEGPVKKIWYFIREYGLYFALIVGTIAAPIGAMRAALKLDQQDYELRKRLVDSWTAPQAAHGYTKPGRDVNLGAKARKVAFQGERPQVDVVCERVQRNLFVITAEFDDKRKSATCVVIEGRKIFFLRHYLEEFLLCPPNTRFYGKYDKRNMSTVNPLGIQFDLRACKVQWYGTLTEAGAYTSDLGLLELPLCFMESKSLVRFIATEEDHRHISGVAKMISTKGMIHEGLRVSRRNLKPVVVASENTSTIIMDDCYTYSLQGRGLCGSILLATNMERPIIGIHVAGVERANGFGISQLLTQEMFKDIPLTDTRYGKTIVQPPLKDEEFSRIDLETAIFPYGCVTDAYSHHQSSTTQYIPSDIHGVMPVLTEPNPLSKNDPRLPPNCPPLKKGCEHLGKPPLDFETEILFDAYKDLTAIIKSSCIPPRTTVGVVSEDIAIVGDSNIPGFEPLKWNTAEGFPLSTLRRGSSKGKKWLFDLELNKTGQYQLLGMHSELRRILDLEQAMRVRGIRPFTVFTDCLKDTCLPSDKCRVPGKTRIFSISPVQFTIAFKRYFLDFLAAYQNARFEAEHAIGINCDSDEWSFLAGRLLAKGGKIIAGDYKNFGPGLMKKAAMQAFEIVLDWYQLHGASDEEQRVRRIMAAEVINAPHLVQNLIYYTPCGIPSGSPITTPLNSLVNSLYIRCVYLYLLKENNLNFSFVDFHNNLSICTYGDDVVIGVTDSFSEWFNTETMAEVFAKYNIVFTDADKSDELVKYRTIDSVTFLKRGFTPHPWRSGTWLAPIDSVSIGSCVNWIKAKGNIQANTLENCEASMLLAFGHGPKFYEDQYETLRKAISAKYGIHWVAKDWRSMDTSVFQASPQMQRQEESHYRHFHGAAARGEYYTWYSVPEVLGIMRRLRSLNYSLQEQRSEGLALLTSLNAELVVSPTNRFSNGRFIAEEMGSFQIKFQQLRLALSYKDVGTVNSVTNGSRNGYNDSMLSFHKSVAAIIDDILAGRDVYDRRRYETQFELEWVD